VSRLGPSAIATVGLTESMLTMVYTMAIGLSIGVTATVARRIGEKEPDQAAASAVQGIVLGIIVAAVLGVFGAILAPRLLRLMGAEPEVVAMGSRFTRIMLGGNVTVVLLFLINATFRGAGDAAIAMRVLWLANCICPAAIMGPQQCRGHDGGPGARLPCSSPCWARGPSFGSSRTNPKSYSMAWPASAS
jgi:Na+-driven multidrug efflux pump